MTAFTDLCQQFLRFAQVGVLSNVLAFVVYLLLCEVGMHPLTAMSVTYVMAVIISYILNQRWTFGRGANHAATRFLVCYLLAWFLNYLALNFLIFNLGYGYAVSQGVLVILIAALMFFAQKYWVFAAVDSEQR